MTQNTQTRLTVLIVEDNPEDKTILRRILVQAGFQVLASTTAREAFDLFVKNRIDIMITDIQLPNMDGCNLTFQIRQAEQRQGNQRKRIPILGFTADESPEIKVRALASGMDDLLRKSKDQSIIIQRVHSLLSRSVPRASEPSAKAG